MYTPTTPVSELVTARDSLLGARCLGDLRKEWLRLRVRLLRKFVEDVALLVIPASLLVGLGEHLGQRAPYTQVAITRNEARCRHATAFQIAQQFGPGLDRFAVAWLQRDDALRAARSSGSLEGSYRSWSESAASATSTAAFSFWRPAFT